MGFQTTLILYNDYVHDLPKLDDIGQTIYHAVLQCSTHDSVDLGHFGTAFRSHHADTTVPMLIGDYTAIPIVPYSNRSYKAKPDESMQIAHLRDIADKLGFYLARKPSKR